MKATASTLSARDDLRHGSLEHSRDSLFFNLILPEEQLGVQVYTWVDHQGVAGRQVAVFGPERRPLALEVEPAVPMGDADFDDWQIAGLEIRHPEPLRKAQVRYRSDAVELDYEFTGVHDAFNYARNAEGCPPWMALDRFEQTGRVQGELRVAGRVVAFDRLAHRDHSWGRRDWGVPHHWKWVVAQTPSGAALHVMIWLAQGEYGVNGYVLRDEQAVPLVDARCGAGYDERMGQRELTATLTDERGGVTDLVMERDAIVRLPFGSDRVVYEAACRASIDGESGYGQFEALWAQSYVERLLAREP